MTGTAGDHGQRIPVAKADRGPLTAEDRQAVLDDLLFELKIIESDFKDLTESDHPGDREQAQFCRFDLARVRRRIEQLKRSCNG